MQKIAAENHLSETAFFVKKESRYELRWFTPGFRIGRNSSGKKNFMPANSRSGAATCFAGKAKYTFERTLAPAPRRSMGESSQKLGSVIACPIAE
jgi:hypothetical protein